MRSPVWIAGWGTTVLRNTCLAGLVLALGGIALLPGRSACAQSFSLLTNGNFETGNFNGWTVTGEQTREIGSTDPTGTVGGFFIDTPGTTTPSTLR